MSKENKERSIAFMMGWHHKTRDVFDDLCDPKWIDHDPAFPFPDLRGPDAAKAACDLYEKAFPDMEVLIEDAIAGEGDTVIIRWIFQGTQTGELPGIPATGKRFSVAGITIDRHANGKMIETWSAWDTLGMMQQLGLVGADAPMGEDG